MTNKQIITDLLDRRRQKAEWERDRRVEKLYRDHPELLAIRQEKRELGRRMVFKALQDKDPKEDREAMQALDRKEKEYLASIRIDESYFQPDYHCKLCGDTGFVEGKSCQCRNRLKLEQNYEFSQIRKQLDLQNFDRFDLSLFRKDRQEGEPVSPYENMRQILLDMEEEYVPYFSTDSPNLYFYGPTGTGKTYLLNCIAKAVLDKGFTVLYQTSGQLLDFMTRYSFMFEQERQQNRDRHDFVYEVDLLIIDDLGAEFVNDKMISVLFDIINGRLISRKPVIISSNLGLDELDGIYDNRIASRIVGEYASFRIYGSDLRRRLSW